MARKAATAPSPKFAVIWRSPHQVMLVGVDLTIASRAQWQREVDRLGDALQEDIYNEFAAERVAGRRLRKNKPEYDAWKVRNGYDPRRGHKQGQLQRNLAGRRLFTISFTAGRIFVTFSESRLRGRVKHAEYYAEKKVTGGKILAFTKKQLRLASARIYAWERAMQAKRKQIQKASAAKTGALLRASGQGLPASVAARVRDLSNAFERQQAFSKAAPFAGRPQFIRPGLGLTQAFMRRFK